MIGCTRGLVNWLCGSDMDPRCCELLKNHTNIAHPHHGVVYVLCCTGATARAECAVAMRRPVQLQSFALMSANWSLLCYVNWPLQQFGAQHHLNLTGMESLAGGCRFDSPLSCCVGPPLHEEPASAWLHSLHQYQEIRACAHGAGRECLAWVGSRNLIQPLPSSFLCCVWCCHPVPHGCMQHSLQHTSQVKHGKV